MWVFERAPDTRRDPTGEKGLWWVGGNSLFIKYAEESALVRGPGMPGTTTAFSHHGARIFNKIVEVYRSNKRNEKNQDGIEEFTGMAHPPRTVGYSEHQEDRSQSTKFVRTYKAMQ